MNEYTIRQLVDDYAHLAKNVEQLIQQRENLSRNTFSSFSRKERIANRIDETESQLALIDNGLLLVDLTDKEDVILHCRLDGMNITNIAKHMGMARKTVYSELEAAVRKITQALTEDIGGGLSDGIHGEREIQELSIR